ELAVLQPPEDMLRPVAADAEIRRLHWLEFLLEDLGTRAAMPFPAPGVGDRITQEQDIDSTFLDHGHKAFVAFHPIRFARHRGDRGMLLRLLRPCRADEETGNQQENRHAAQPMYVHECSLPLVRK